jgi:NADPH-dependent 2,4-dienoyl-CoA reductase/sulfur reductase-like enzyme/rhodanese-related sulfurtransferase
MPPKAPLRIVIVGGVAGGMSAATRARRLSETAVITVLEKGPYVSYANCGLPYALGGIITSDSSLILQTPETFKERFNIDVHTNSEVIAIDPIKKLVDVQMFGTGIITQHRYDKLVISQGAEPFKPPIEGIDFPHVFTLQTIPDLQKIKSYISEQGSKTIAIIGGGFIGIEVADALHSLGGLKISIIEYTTHIFPLLDADITEPLHTEIRRNGINLLLNARIQRIEAAKGSNGANVVVAHEEPVPADIVIVCVGTRTRTALAHSAGLIIGKTGVTVNESMQTSDTDIYAVGDMVETLHQVADRPLNVALAGPANRQGRLAADNIFGRKVAYRGNVGTSACKVFDLTVASTGFSVHSLKDMGMEVQWVTVHPPDHAAYYPGACQMTLKVIFDPSTGKLLGAEAVGKSGIDKRIDVLSTALQAGMTIYDLEHLELAYAPPYGSAKDPVNMAGFVGSNVLRGDVEIVHPEELNLDDGDVEMEIVDVRSKKEFEGGHLRGARNLPINGLRESLEKGVLGNGQGRKVLVYCQVGYRGYLGYRILKQKGFKVVNLDGGYKSVAEGGFRGLQEGGFV